MVRKIFTNGDILYAEDVNLIGNPIVDGEDLLGHGVKVLDDYLDDGSDQLKSRFYNFYNRLKVSHQTGLTFSYLGGIVLLNNGTPVSITPGTINVSDNTTSLIFVNSSGIVTSAASLPNECFPLAIVTTSGGTLSGSIQDIRDKLIDRITPSNIPTTSSFQSGMGMEYWGGTLPSGGWLWQDGASYNPSEYPTLFAAIGYTHGIDGTKFKVPDHRGRVGVGVGFGAGLTNRTLGQTFGEETVTLTISNIPSHNHGINDLGHNHSVNEVAHSHGVSDPGHSHGVSDSGHSHATYANTTDGSSEQRDRTDGFLSKVNVAITGEDVGGKGYITTNLNGVQLISTSGSNIGISGSGTSIGIGGNKTNVNLNATTSGISVNAQGGGGSHNNIQPSIVCNYIIKI